MLEAVQEDIRRAKMYKLHWQNEGLQWLKGSKSTYVIRNYTRRRWNSLPEFWPGIELPISSCTPFAGLTKRSSRYTRVLPHFIYIQASVNQWSGWNQRTMSFTANVFHVHITCSLAQPQLPFCSNSTSTKCTFHVGGVEQTWQAGYTWPQYMSQQLWY